MPRGRDTGYSYRTPSEGGILGVRSVSRGASLLLQSSHMGCCLQNFRDEGFWVFLLDPWPARRYQMGLIVLKLHEHYSMPRDIVRAECQEAWYLLTLATARPGLPYCANARRRCSNRLITTQGGRILDKLHRLGKLPA